MKLGARYYDPAIGRFITKDPARDGANWYAYAGNDPVNAVNPTFAGRVLCDALVRRRARLRRRTGAGPWNSPELPNPTSELASAT